MNYSTISTDDESPETTIWRLFQLLPMKTMIIVFSSKSNIKMKTICDYLKKGEHLRKGISEEDLKTLFRTTKPPMFREFYGKEKLMKNDFESLMIQFGMRVSIGVIRSRIEENTGDSKSYRIQTLTIESTDAKFILNTENPWNHEKICRRVTLETRCTYMTSHIGAQT